MQLIWMGLSGVLIFLILLSDVGWFETFAPIFYLVMMGLLLVTIFIAPDIKGSHSWLVLGPMRLQPAEFAKIATALMLATTLSRYKFRLNSWRAYGEVFAIVLLPMMLIFLQKEAGSALVYTALFLALYREGLSGIPWFGLCFRSPFCNGSISCRYHVGGNKCCLLGYCYGHYFLHVHCSLTQPKVSLSPLQLGAGRLCRSLSFGTSL